MGSKVLGLGLVILFIISIIILIYFLGVDRNNGSK